MRRKQKQYKKIAFALSLCMLMLWGILGTGTSLAWFTDTSEEITNIFHMADFELEVSHRLPDGETYEVIDATTKIFDDEALYEPGYVQVVYLKVKNKGDVEFKFKLAVTITDYTVATNVFGLDFNLQDYLKFGVVCADNEEQLEQMIANRESAKKNAVMPLSNYATDTMLLDAGEVKYMAIIVRMPEEVGNEANYRGDTVPRVELGISVDASQVQMSE